VADYARAIPRVRFELARNSNRSRVPARMAQEFSGSAAHPCEHDEDSEFIRERRRTWARLLRKIFRLYPKIESPIGHTQIIAVSSLFQHQFPDRNRKPAFLTIEHKRGAKIEAKPGFRPRPATHHLRTQRLPWSGLDYPSCIFASRARNRASLRMPS